MSPLLILAVTAIMVATAFLSGIFGMAGGLILIGVLLVLLPLPEAMALHAVTQMASNGWRGLFWWRHVRWRTVAVYLIGCLLALVAWSLWRYVPSKPIALIGLGITPFLVRLLPAGLKPNPDSAPQTVIYGVLCTTLTSAGLALISAANSALTTAANESPLRSRGSRKVRVSR